MKNSIKFLRLLVWLKKLKTENTLELDVNTDS